MSNEATVEKHYTHGSLVDAIAAGVRQLGKTAASVTLDDLAPVDEFHIGGRGATQEFLDQLALSEGKAVLDVGCGLGGASRFAASHYGSTVTGIDLTGEYIETGRELCRWVGLDGRVSLHQGSALSMPFGSGSFDAAYMLHVGMNIADKAALASEVHRVLKPGGVFGVYDVMRTGEAPLQYPVPWAATPEANAVAPPSDYKSALEAAGFTIACERNRRDFALAFFDQMRARIGAAGGPPPLGIHILMGKDTPTKVANMIANVAAGSIAPVEIIARKA
jgi:SAM-dependent methyltransferase